MSTEYLERAIVRICTASRNYIGIGVLVSSKHVLTCAHVVADALKRSRTQQEQPTEIIYLDFPFVASGQVFSAKVVFWRPVIQDQSVLTEMGEDIAGLELEEAPPLEAKPIELQSVQAAELEGHPFEVFGIPAGNPQGAWANGIVLKRLANGWIQIEDKEQGGFQVEPGFSGSPIWDKQFKAVIGITVATDPKRPQAKVGFMIPTQVLFKAWIGLEKIRFLQYQQCFSEVFPEDFPLRLPKNTQTILQQEQQKTRLTSGEVNLIEQELIKNTLDKHSSFHIDYTELMELLASSMWKEADQKTWELILEIIVRSKTSESLSLDGIKSEIDTRQEEGAIFRSEINSFSCKDINTIDRLWMKYSNGRFGFNVQKEIWDSICNRNNLTDKDKHIRLAIKLGWCKVGERTVKVTQKSRIKLQEISILGKSFGKVPVLEKYLIEDKESIVRWSMYEDLTFASSAPLGHFPAKAAVGVGVEDNYVYGGWMAMGAPDGDPPWTTSSVTKSRDFKTQWYNIASPLAGRGKEYEFTSSYPFKWAGESGFYYLRDIFACLEGCKS
jgi:hypothetical protein